MIGCRHGAKNTLVKNYLWFAERLGVEILPERQAARSARSAPPTAPRATRSPASTPAPGCAGAGGR